MNDSMSLALRRTVDFIAFVANKELDIADCLATSATATAAGVHDG